MASIRRPSTPGIAARPVTVTPASTFDNLLGFANSVAGLGASFRRLSERRNDRRRAEERARATDYEASLNDQLDHVKLNSIDYGAASKAAGALESKAQSWAEENLESDEERARFVSRVTALKDRVTDPFLEAESARRAEERVREAFEVESEHIPADLNALGDRRYSEDPSERESAARSLANMRDAHLNPDGIVAQTSGVDGASAAWRARSRAVDTGTAWAYLSANAGKDLPGARATFIAGGVPMPDGSVVLDDATPQERRQIWNDWVRMQEIGEDRRKAVVKAREEAEETHDAGVEAAYYEALARGERPGLDYLEKFNDPTYPGIRRIRAEMGNTDWRSPEQQAAHAEAEAYIEGRIGYYGTAQRNSARNLDMLAAEVETRTDLAPEDKATLVQGIREKAGEARDNHLLPPRVRQEKAAIEDLDRRFKELTPTLPVPEEGDTGAAALMHVEEQSRLDGIQRWHARMVADPGFQVTAVHDVAVALGNARTDTQTTQVLQRAFDDPEDLKVLRDDPAKVLGFLPHVMDEQFVITEQGHLALDATVVQMRATLEAEGLAGDTLLADPRYVNTLETIDFLERTRSIRVHRDPRKELADEEAEAQLAAHAGPTGIQHPPGIRSPMRQREGTPATHRRRFR